MRCPRIANLPGLGSSLGVMLVAISLLFACIVRATEIEQLTDKLPRACLGEFAWEGDKTVQNVVITLEAVRALNDQNVEALGCGSYEVNRQVTMIKIRMFVRLSDLYVEIIELSRQGSAGL